MAENKLTGVTFRTKCKLMEEDILKERLQLLDIDGSSFALDPSDAFHLPYNSEIISALNEQRSSVLLEQFLIQRDGTLEWFQQLEQLLRGIAHIDAGNINKEIVLLLIDKSLSGTEFGPPAWGSLSVILNDKDDSFVHVAFNNQIVSALKLFMARFGKGNIDVDISTLRIINALLRIPDFDPVPYIKFTMSPDEHFLRAVAELFVGVAQKSPAIIPLLAEMLPFRGDDLIYTGLLIDFFEIVLDKGFNDLVDLTNLLPFYNTPLRDKVLFLFFNAANKVESFASKFIPLSSNLLLHDLNEIPIITWNIFCALAKWSIKCANDVYSLLKPFIPLVDDLDFNSKKVFVTVICDIRLLAKIPVDDSFIPILYLIEDILSEGDIDQHFMEGAVAALLNLGSMSVDIHDALVPLAESDDKTVADYAKTALRFVRVEMDEDHEIGCV